MSRRRRAVAVLLAASVAAASVAACGSDDDTAAVEPEVTIAFLRAVPGAPSTEPAFTAELRRAGFREGQNLTIRAKDPDEAYSDPEEAAAAIDRWEAEGLDLIVALSSGGARVAAEAAPDVDVLFLSNDPTATGLVEDESSPEGRLTGVTFRVPADRTLSLAARAVPGLTRVGLPYPPSDPAAMAHLAAVQDAAPGVGVELLTAPFTDDADAPAAVEALVAQGVGALLLSTSPTASRSYEATAAAAAARGLPIVANTTLVSTAVVSLSPDTDELGRQLGRQAARLLGGADASTVPVEDPARFILTVNAAVAAQLGRALPPDLLREANAVVE